MTSKTTKRILNAEIVISQKLLFFVVSVVKLHLSAFAWRKGDSRMSRQCMRSTRFHVLAYHRETWIRTRNVADIVIVTRNVTAIFVNQLQDTWYVWRRPRQGRPRSTTANNTWYIHLTARRDSRVNAMQILR